MERLRQAREWQLYGFYYYDSEHFVRHSVLIREYFAPVAAIKTQVDLTVSRARAVAEVLVGVHVRHGDYATFADGQMFYSLEEYRALMQLVMELFPGKALAFLVCSNANLDTNVFEGLRCFFGPSTTVGDLYCLAACDYIVGPSSSYSEWASFYGQVPRYVYNKGSLSATEGHGLRPPSISLT